MHLKLSSHQIQIRPHKNNMEPKSEGFKNASPFQMGDFQVPC